MPRQAAHRIRLNKTNVAGLPVPAKPAYVWDSDLQGFGVRLSPSGRRTFIVVGTTAAGKQIKHKVGVFGRITPEQAREIATRKLGELAAGHDLAAERRQARAAERARLAAPTMRELADGFLNRYSRVYKRTWKGDADMISRLILPSLRASRRAADITRSDVEALHRGLRRTPYMANRVVSLCVAMFNRQSPGICLARRIQPWVFGDSRSIRGSAFSMPMRSRGCRGRWPIIPNSRARGR